MPDLTYAELFAGAGGLSMGLELAGWRCLAHAEIEPHARAVLRKHWPDVRLDGDVSAINGADYAGVTLLSGGSPCQDLSIAGKRKGLGGERSGLFHQQVRIWRESGAPLFLWENVLGALSSNKGEDFGVVLSTIVGGAVPVPADGWGGAGVASGPAGVAAWRVLDGQYFGVGTLGTPQRRRRVFVLGVADGSVDPAEVLSLSESLSGHPASGGETGQGVAADSGAGIEGASRGVIPLDVRNATRTTDVSEQNRQGLGVGEDGDPSPTLTGLFTPAVLAYDDRNQAASTMSHHTLRADGIGGRVSDAVLTFQQRGRDDGMQVEAREDGIANSLRSPAGGRSGADLVLTYPIQNPGVEKEQNGLGIGDANAPMFTLEQRGHGVVTYDTRGNGDGRVVNTMAGDHQNRVTDYTALVLRNREGKPGGGKGPLVSAERSLTLGTANDQVVFTKQAYGQYADAPSVASTLGARDHAATNIDIAVGVGIPRRLTPLECERLMSWPDNHTAIGIDEKGREYALSDTARYKLCGNGVLSACVAWIGMRLKDALDSRQAVV